MTCSFVCSVVAGTRRWGWGRGGMCRRGEAGGGCVVVEMGSDKGVGVRKARLWEEERPENGEFGGDESEECSWEHVEEMVDVLGEQIAEEEIDLVMGITRGGMVPATLICERFQLRNLMSATVLFYTDSGARFYGLTQPRFLHFPEDRLIEGRKVLVVDDVWDTGNTARCVRERVRRAGGIPKVAVLHFKNNRNQFEDDRPDYYAQLTDHWILYPWEPHPHKAKAPTEQQPQAL